MHGRRTGRATVAILVVAGACVAATAARGAMGAPTRAEVDLRVAELIRQLPQRNVLSGRGMPSKLGLLYVMGSRESAGFYRLAELGMIPIVKTGRADSDRGATVKQHNPRAIWVMGLGCSLKQDETTPKQAADTAYEHMVKEFEKVPAERRRLLDFLSVAPCMWEPKSEEDGLWFSAYLCELLPRIARWGPRAVVLNSGVGGLPTDRDPAVLDAMSPGLRLAQHLGGAWGCHGYTLKYTTDLSEESWYSLRYRRAYQYFGEKHPDLAKFPMILLEGGVDRMGNPDEDGWLARGSLEKYTQWLAWYDAELLKDDYVLGVTLFKIGAPSSWKSFEMEPVCPWLARHHQQARTARGRAEAAQVGNALLRPFLGR